MSDGKTPRSTLVARKALGKWMRLRLNQHEANAHSLRTPTVQEAVAGVGLLERRQSFVDLAVEDYLPEAEAVARTLLDAFDEIAMDEYSLELANCVFVGHTNTDMDSIASAIGAAHLFGGRAARASEVNTETEWALNFWNATKPPPFLEVHQPGENVCLVDHCQMSQTTEGVRAEDIRGIIDHHALQANTIVTDLPIYVDIRPWGSACTIIAHTYCKMRRSIPPTIAGMLLSGILSDTLNLRSPTTTVHDMKMVPLLAKLSNTPDANILAGNLFKAKSAAQHTLSAHDLVRGDTKTFEFRCARSGANISVSFGVIETTDLEGVMQRSVELMAELRALKKEEEVDVAFLALCDIGQIHSELLLCGLREQALAGEAYRGSLRGEYLMDLGDRVSRKKNFVPAISQVFAAGFALPECPATDEEFGPVYMDCSAQGCRLVRAPPGTPRTVLGKQHHARYPQTPAAVCTAGHDHGPAFG